MSTPARPRRIAILAPMPSELRPVVRALSLRRARSARGVLFSGALGGIELLAATTGIGTRAAARAAERMLDSAEVDRVVVVGVAGGIGPGVRIGDLVVPEQVVDLATGAERRPSRLGDATPHGVLATADGILTDREELARLEGCGVVAIDMETAAIAEVCERRERPWSVFRAISDRADDGSTDEAVFGLVGPDGRPDLAALARFVLTQPRRVPQLARLGRGLRLATSAAASAAARALATL